MTPEIEKALRQDFPQLYGKLDYFSCGNGWEKIIRELSTKILDVSPHVYATCVKEKYSTLRYYWKTTDTLSQAQITAIEKLIREAEDKTEVTCERCGDEAAGSTSGNFQILCSKHLQEANDYIASLRPRKRAEEFIDALSKQKQGDGADWNRLVIDPLIENRKRSGLPADPSIKRSPEKS